MISSVAADVHVRPDNGLRTRQRIGALAAAMAGVWGGLVAAGRARLRRRLAVGRAEAAISTLPEMMAWPSCHFCGHDTAIERHAGTGRSERVSGAGAC